MADSERELALAIQQVERRREAWRNNDTAENAGAYRAARREAEGAASRLVIQRVISSPTGEVSDARTTEPAPPVVKSTP